MAATPRTCWAEFRKAGVDLDALATKLQEEGAASFVASWDELLGVIDSKSCVARASELRPEECSRRQVLVIRPRVSSSLAAAAASFLTNWSTFFGFVVLLCPPHTSLFCFSE